MLKNVTLSAEETLIRKAKEKARHQRMSLNAIFRRWLMHYVGKDKITTDYNTLMERLAYAQAGRSFTREELNER
jgi:predicted transcriptional regulator